MIYDLCLQLYSLHWMLCFCEGDETAGKRDLKMMCIRGYSSDIPDVINLDEKLETASKLPPNNGQFDKSFVGKCTILL